MRRLIVGTLVAAGLFLTRIVLLMLGLALRRMDGSATAQQPAAPPRTQGHARTAPAT